MLIIYMVTQPLPFDELKLEKIICLKEILNAPYDNNIG